MKKHYYFTIIPFFLSCFITGIAYAQAPENLVTAKQAVIHYYEDTTANQKTEFENDVTAITQKAEAYLNEQLAHKKETAKLAMVLDIDDTSVSNYSLLKSRDFKDSKEDYEKSYTDLSLPAIKPILALYNEAIKKGISVFFITFRSTKNPQIDIRANTIATLNNAGYFGWSGIYLPNAAEAQEPSCVYKTKIRESLEKQGYTIVLNIGDQDGDLAGGHAEHIFKVPNPLYVVQSNCVLKRENQYDRKQNLSNPTTVH